ncbi:putative C6 transcription factor [Hypoxylon fragiforme]|uniref:putative C6 transcription factor n=1 Tax=Hypoxylon fragiforme TaxID=63214 RepID=UPI0020C5BAA5|nr:putative C6 transcription factor [Hypoxylon fragiforme]KAI2611671.1 putative C6 transcription factor [Hypoxylon fragiforme]
MPDPERRRRRPPVSCSLCRKRKIRCNRESPCSNCLRSRHHNGDCVYEELPPHRPARATTTAGPGLDPAEEITQLPILIHGTSSHTSTSLSPTTLSHASNPFHPSSIQKVSSSSSTAASTLNSSEPSPSEIEALKRRIRCLEEQLSSHAAASQSSSTTRTSALWKCSPTSNNIETISSRISGTFYIHHEGRQSPAISRSVTHKNRIFGQSHWVNGFSLMRDIIDLIEPHVRDNSKAALLMQRSKELARIIKARRAPPWPSLTVSHLPPKDVADELLDCYLRTTEPIYRVLHIPTFKRDYEAHWISPASTNKAFLVQMKLVLAIGAATYDDKFTLRASAIQWVYEAHTWISEPGFKHRLSAQYIQTNILLLLSREIVDVGPDLVWVAAGSLLRRAMHMGLHRDPAHLPKTTTFVSEMRRRLWNSVLELSLQSSLTSGGPPLISLDMFDTAPPGNFDDEQLLLLPAASFEDPRAAEEEEEEEERSAFTQMSTALAIRRTFAARLAVARFLNSHGSRGTYAETLRLDAELRAAYRPVLQSFQAYRSSAAGPRPSQYEMDVVSLIVNRYVLSLHVPFVGPALHEAPYAYSRKVAVETALKIWRLVYPSPQQQQLTTPNPTSPHDLSRLSVSGSGFFRIVTLQASLLIATEIRAQIAEEETLGPGLVRADLVSTLAEGKSWTLKSVEAGETSIKGHFIACVIAAQIEGRMRGLRGDELTRFVVRAAEDAEERCVPLLEEMVAAAETREHDNNNNNNNDNSTSETTPSQTFGDWDFVMSDCRFDFDDTEPINWAFDEFSQGPII